MIEISNYEAYRAAKTVEINLGTAVDILMELDPATASSRDKGLLIEQVQRIMRESG